MRESRLVRDQSLVSDHILVPLRVSVGLKSSPCPLEGAPSNNLVRKSHLLLVLLLIHLAHDLTHGCLLASWYLVALNELMVARRNRSNSDV